MEIHIWALGFLPTACNAIRVPSPCLEEAGESCDHLLAGLVGDGGALRSASLPMNV